MTSLSSSLTSVDFLLLKSRPPLKSSRTSGQYSICNDALSCNTNGRNNTHPKFTRAASASTLRTLNGSSDSSRPPTSSAYSSRRMSAMLKSPAVRKHIAESFGLDPESADVDEMIKYRFGSSIPRTPTGSRKNSVDVSESPILIPMHADSSLSTSDRRVSWAAEPTRDKRYRSSDDVISEDSSVNHVEQLLRLLKVGAAPPAGDGQRDSDDEVATSRRQARVKTMSTCSAPFRMPTFDEFVRERRGSLHDNELMERSATDDMATLRLNKTPNAAAGRIHGPCHNALMSSFGGSFNDLRHIDGDCSTRELRQATVEFRPRDVSSERNKNRRVDDVWTVTSADQLRSNVKRRDYRNRRLEVDCDGLVTLFVRRGSSRRRYNRPPDVNGLNLTSDVKQTTDTVTALMDDDTSLSSTSGDDNSASCPRTMLANGAVNSHDSLLNNFSRQSLTVRENRCSRRVTSLQGGTTVESVPNAAGSSVRSCRCKPPAHPQPSSKPPRAPPTSAAATTTDHRQPSPPSTRVNRRQQQTSADQQSLEYDHSIWDFLQPDPPSSSTSPPPATSGVKEQNESRNRSQNGVAVIGKSLNTTITKDTEDKTDVVSSRSVEQIEAVREIVETEISYGNDLAIIRNEFYVPLKSNGLLTATQLDTVFLNLNQLMANNEFFISRLQANTTYCASEVNTKKSHRINSSKDSLRNDQVSGTKSDETANGLVPQSTIDVRIGRAFLEARHMLIAFETYCINQAAAVYLVDQLTQERELLRVFLDELPKDRVSLRKMDLKSFLMIPVQRVMKYPLLLDRLFKATPDEHPDKQEIHLACKYIQQTLSSINAKAIGSLRAKRRTSAALQVLLKRTLAVENVELTQFVFDLLKWTRNDTHLVLVGRLLCTTVVGRRRTKDSSNSKYQALHCVLATHGMNPTRGTLDIGTEPAVELIFPRITTDEQTSAKQAAVVLVKERAGKFTVFQGAPLMLDRCVVSSDSPSFQSFDLHEMNGNTYRLKAEDMRETQAWHKQLQQLTLELGPWRRRRNALPNVMTHRREDFT